MPTHDSELHVCPYCKVCGRVALATCPPDWLDDERCSSSNCSAHGVVILGGTFCKVHGEATPLGVCMRGETAMQWANRKFGDDR